MKQKAPLTYEVPRPARETSRVWDFLAGGALIAPFLTVPVFIFGAAYAQDYLITGDGLSWRRATLYFGVPTGVISAAGLVAAIRAVALGPRPAPRRSSPSPPTPWRSESSSTASPRRLCHDRQ